MSGRLLLTLTSVVLLAPLTAAAEGGLLPRGGQGPQPGNPLYERSALIESLAQPSTTWEARQTPDVTRLMNTAQNWDAGTGVMMYSYQAIDIRNSPLTAQQMFAQLRTFEHFSARNVAEVRLVRAQAAPGQREGRQWALFRARSEYPGLVGVLNGLQEFVNSRWVPVEIFYDNPQMSIQAATMGDHMIVGSRRWTIHQLPDGVIRIETEAWEQRNGSANDIAMRTGVPPILNGKDVMALVWNVYLNNLGRHFTQNGGSFSYAPNTNGASGFWRERPAGGRNPFQPGTPYYEPGDRRRRTFPGTLPAPGSFGPPAPAPRVASSAGAGGPTILALQRFSTINCHQPPSNNGGFSMPLSGFAPILDQGAQPRRLQDTRLTPEQQEMLRQILHAAPAEGAGRLRD